MGDNYVAEIFSETSKQSSVYTFFLRLLFKMASNERMKLVSLSAEHSSSNLKVSCYRIKKNQMRK